MNSSAFAECHDLAGSRSSGSLDRSAVGGLCGLTTLALAFSDHEIRSVKLQQIRSTLHSGAYRVPTAVVAACLLLDMLEQGTRTRH